mmetsp:Transcript_1980/g.7871  ORF Transcript_1980/g.7871 Transcript_1980/m.7871 type:complete len:216 (-) Transcript_1980:505-1152(-)
MTTHLPCFTACVKAPGCHANSPGVAPTTYDPSNDLESVCASKCKTTKSSFPVRAATSSITALLPAPAGPSSNKGRFWHSARAVASMFFIALRVRTMARPRLVEETDARRAVVASVCDAFDASLASRRRISTPPTRACPGAAGRSKPGRECLFPVSSSSSSSSSSIASSSTKDSETPSANATPSGSRNAAARSRATAAFPSAHRSSKACLSSAYGA